VTSREARWKQQVPQGTPSDAKSEHQHTQPYHRSRTGAREVANHASTAMLRELAWQQHGGSISNPATRNTSVAMEYSDSEVAWWTEQARPSQHRANWGAYMDYSCKEVHTVPTHNSFLGWAHSTSRSSSGALGASGDPGAGWICATNSKLGVLSGRCKGIDGMSHRRGGNNADMDGKTLPISSYAIGMYDTEQKGGSQGGESQQTNQGKTTHAHSQETLMTVGQLVEWQASKAHVHRGPQQSGTSNPARNDPLWGASLLGVTRTWNDVAPKADEKKQRHETGSGFPIRQLVKASAAIAAAVLTVRTLLVNYQHLISSLIRFIVAK